MLAHVRKIPSSPPWQTTVHGLSHRPEAKSKKAGEMSRENRPRDSTFAISYPFLTKRHNLCYDKLRLINFRASCDCPADSQGLFISEQRVAKLDRSIKEARHTHMPGKSHLLAETFADLKQC